MRQYKVFTNLTGSGQTTEVVFARDDVTEEVVLVQWNGVGTCDVQVRLTSDMNWTTVHTFTVSGFETIQMCPRMRFSYNVTSGTGQVGIYG